MQIIKKNNKLIAKEMIRREQVRINREDTALAMLIGGLEASACSPEFFSSIVTKGPKSDEALANKREEYRGMIMFQVACNLDKVNVNALDSIFA